MTAETQNTNRPVENFRDGAIQVAVWPRQGPKGTFYEIERTRSYKDRDDKWQKTPLISERDMLKARRLEDQAYEAIQRLKDQDRALKDFQRSNGAETPGQSAGQPQPEPELGFNDLQQTREDAMSQVPEQQPEPQREPDREP